ncbi:MAG: GGDEF domain-containing protein [Spirochaetia bacterium]|nr:GGDEF domain-containing protein [Spirochaetia bacterium]
MEKPEQLAFIDSLTGVGNRRYSEIKIAAKLEEMNRYARFGLLFTDIDNFKQFNDTHGHDTGDRVLKLADRSVMSNLREDDFAGRWGGEEFIAIISNVNREEFVATADKLRGMIERSSLEMAGQEPSHVTVSVGAVVAKRDDDMENLVMKARKTAGIL